MLLFFGFYVVILFLFYQLNILLNRVEKKFFFQFLTSDSEKIKDWILPLVSLNFLGTQFVPRNRELLLFWRSQIWSLKKFLFASAQTLFSYFWLILILVILFEINSGYIFVMVACIFIVDHLCMQFFKQLNVKWLSYFIEILVVLGIILFFIEQVIRLAPVYLPYLEETGIVFYLTDSAILNGLGLLFMTFVLGFFLPIQGFGLILGLFLYLNSQISYVNLAFLISGESFFWIFQLGYLFYKSGKNYFKYTYRLGFYLILSQLAFLFSAYLIKSNFLFNGGYGDFYSLKLNFLSLVVLNLVLKYFTFMIWGHFNSALPKGEILITDKTLVDEKFIYFDEKSLFWIYQKLDQRLKKILQFQLELNEHNKDKIPLFTLEKFDNERAVLNDLVQVINVRLKE
ncbi:MAG: hypothetical protein L6Q37_10945 [Bdellovibrionaceae bacterium]|nr:hypothetical protein [Pseudobdellovibrionaceae bacterium]NUM57180.1 hypothetical protein [Pseudobdellovibrionaceae bacterium]